MLREAWTGGRIRLFAPSLMIFEVANSIWKNPNTGDDLARSLVKAAMNLSPTLINPTALVVGQAMLVARKATMTFYDAVYLALAKSMSLRLISADHKQLSASSRHVNAVHIAQVPEIIS